MLHKYVIITPAKDEAKNIVFTIDSLVKQSLKPQTWIIVDDGSSDETAIIAQQYAEQYSWIRVLKHSTQKETRAGGGKIIRAFKYGYKYLQNKNFDFIVKLDADVELPPSYFEQVAHCFTQHPKVGLAGGYCVALKNGKWQREYAASYHLRGPIKSYRKNCFQEIGGLKEIMGWEGLDEMQAMFLGWEVKILDIPVKLHRSTGQITTSTFLSHVPVGKAHYQRGYDFPLAILKGSVRAFNMRPYGLSFFAFFYGYIYGFLFTKRIVSKDFVRFVRKYQYDRIKTIYKIYFNKYLKY